MTRNALGRGLGALIREPERPTLESTSNIENAGNAIPLTPPAVTSAPPTPDATPRPVAVPSPPRAIGGPHTVDIDVIDPSPFQPRTHFREEALAELSQSIQSSGIIQPLVVRPVGTRYQLLAGERRWRAAQRAGLTRVPVVIREVSDEAALEITLVENIQREDLNPIEEARAFERLMGEFHLTQEDIAARTGKDRATVANAVRLLRLDPPTLDLIEEGRLSAGHGRALLAVADIKVRAAFARRASRGGLTVRQIERLAARRARAAKGPLVEPLDANTRSALEQLQLALGTRVSLRPATKTRPGELVIEYYEEAQLAGLYDRLMR